MANTGYTSPFPTSHDTIGQSTLATPLFMPSSPPQHSSNHPTESPPRAESPERVPPEENDNDQDRDDEHAHHSDNEVHNPSRSSTPGSLTGSDLDARLADYTLDFNRFPSGFSADAEPLPQLKHNADDKLSDVGGPEDFTANLEKYLMGQDEGTEVNTTQGNRAGAEFGSASQHYSSKARQPAVEEEAESGEYSEFGPPVDMSTPSHLLHRTSAFTKDSTHLEDIEEDPADDPENPASPSVRKQSVSSSKDAEYGDLRQRVAELEQTVRDRDEQLQRNRSRVLEAVSAGEQIRHLQAELQRRDSLLNEMQHDDRGRLSQMASPGGHDLSALRHQIRDMQQEIQNRNSQSSLDTERLETISHLRQQLNLTQEQLKKRDAALDETVAKLREVTGAKESQLLEKNSEIDGVKAQIDDQALENERLEMELDRVKSEHQALANRFTTLETRNRPLEEKNSTLEADLTRAQSQVEAQENALKAVAADLPIGGHSTYAEILDLIKDLGHTNPPFTSETSPRDKPSETQDVQQLRQEITQLQQELQEASAAQKAADAEVQRLKDQATESQHLIQSVESENARLTKRVDDLTASLRQSQHELTQTREELAESQETIARLQEAKAIEPPSPPLSPPKTHGAANSQQRESTSDTSAAAESHQAQLRSLQTAHSTAISTLRSSHAESMRKMRNSLTAAEQREANLRSELDTLRTSSAAQESQLCKTFKSEIRRLEAIIAAKEETAAAVDQQIALSVDKREREWERRVKLLLKDRDRMGKALMQAWGEKELGRGPGVLAEDKGNRRREPDLDEKQGQAYQYKYAQKHKT